MAKKIFTGIGALLLVGAGVLILYLVRLQVPRHIVNAATVLGTVAGILLMLAGLCLPLIIKAVRALWAKKAGKIILSAVCALFVAGIAVFGITLGSILSAQNHTAAGQSTLIVLGCQIRGSTPSRMFYDRTEAAYVYLCENEQAVAILSGGQGEDEDLSEAQCMYNLLTEKGIDPKRLYMEDKSVNTDTNIKNSLAIIEQNGFSKEVAIATSDYHQKRAAMICEKYGLSAYAVNAQTQAYLVPVFYTREVLAVLGEKIFKN
ncbi:MAG: YdcF family protein [Clostridia bacterium]|nr:YdcF family protein [Clostridia bacterium]